MPSPVPSFARFLSDSRGSVVAAFGLLVPLLAGAALFAIDHVAVSNRNAELQRAADITALGTVRSLRFTGTSGGAGGSADDGLTAIATSIARNSIDVIGDGLIVKATRTGSDGVRVSLTTRHSTILGGFSGLRDLEVTAEAEAELFGARNICVIAFEEDQQVGINLEDSARIEAGDCGLYSNSQAVSSVIANDSAYIKSEFVCAVGGYTGPDGNYSSKVTTDCPPIVDPLAARAVPEAPAHCDHNYLVLTSGAHTLEPGHYCGGLIVGGTAEVQMNPGVYILSNGPMIVQNEAILSGERVGIVMDDARGNIIFEHDADISLSAPTDGDLAGIVIASRKVCTDNANCHSRIFNITSAHVRSLLGTIYVPEDRFIIDTTMPISGEAAFTIILSRFMQGQQAPTLVLNTNYDATDVPVPDGFIGAKGSRLVR